MRRRQFISPAACPLAAWPLAVRAQRAVPTIGFRTRPGDPVGSGLIARLNRPGGNATGISTLNDELAAQRLGLLPSNLRLTADEVIE